MNLEKMKRLLSVLVSLVLDTSASMAGPLSRLWAHERLLSGLLGDKVSEVSWFDVQSTLVSLVFFVRSSSAISLLEQFSVFSDVKYSMPCKDFIFKLLTSIFVTD